MKYIYLILIALSSFFTNKSLQANQDGTQIAFFMPPNSMQQNIYIPAISNNTLQQDIQSTKENSNISQPNIASQEINEIEPTITPQKNTPAPKKKSPTVAKTLNKKQPKQDKQATTTKATTKVAPTTVQPTDFSNIEFDSNVNLNTEKENNEIEKNSPENEETKTASSSSDLENTTSYIKQLYQKDLKELLYSVPYPNKKQPKYKQLYNIYLLDLRGLYRYKKLSENIEQNLTLKKAKSMKKFEVK